MSTSSPAPGTSPAPRAAGEGAVTLAHPPAVVAALLRAMLPPPRRPWRRRLLRFMLVTLVLAAGAAALQLDQAYDFPYGAFAWLVPFSWLGVVAVLNATDPRPPGAAEALRKVGCLVVLAVVLVGAGVAAFHVFIEPFALGERAGRSWELWLGGSLAALVAGGLVARALHAGRALESDGAARLQAAAEVAEALADDAAPAKPVVGFVDLSGPEQPAKHVRESTAVSGAKVTLYRDEWLRLRFVLRDGNRLRVSAVDRVKVRAGRWKRGSSGKQKWKQGRSDWLSTLELQLTVNPAVYRLKARVPAGAARVSVKAAAPGTAPVLSLVHATNPKAFNPTEALRAVAGLYARLERGGAQQ